MHVPWFIFVGLHPVSGEKTDTYCTCYLYWFLTPFSHVAHMLPRSFCRAPFQELKRTLFEAYIGCDTFGNALFTEFLWAHNQHLRSAIFKRAWPYCQPLTIIIDTCVFPFIFPPHLFIPPLFHLSSHFLSSSSPSLPSPAIHYCSLWRVPGGSLSSSIPLGER